jgi:hypothetical protein
MSLLQEIQKDAVDASVDVSVLLRKCKILATRLKHDKFNKWVESELNGYKTVEELPEYRTFDVHSFGHFAGPFGSGLTNAPIPAICLPEDLQHIANKAYMLDGVSTYSSLVRGKSNDNLTSHWPAEIIALYGKNIYKNANCLDAWSILHPSQVQNMLDTIRNRVLSFVLEVEAEAPAAGEASPEQTPIPNERVNHIYQTYILGNVGNVSTAGTNVTQIAVNGVEQNNIESLLDYFRTLQVREDDLMVLKSALEKDDIPKDKTSLGKNVSGWLGKMISKAASGGWKISTSVAAEVLSKAICNYYGLTS